MNYPKIYLNDNEFYKNKNKVNWIVKSYRHSNKYFTISRDNLQINEPINLFLENGMRISFSVDDPNLYIKFSNWYYIFEDICDKEFDIKFTTQIENDKNIDILDIDINSDSIKWSKNRNYFSR